MTDNDTDSTTETAGKTKTGSGSSGPITSEKIQLPTAGRATAMRIYAALALALVLSFVPSVPFAGLSLGVFLATLIAAYIIRHKADNDSFVDNHMTFVIRTMWIAALLSVVTLTIGMVYLLSSMDPTPLMNCMTGVDASTQPDYEEFRRMITPCTGQFMLSNRTVFTIAGSIAIIPVVLYMLFRLGKGLWCARKGQTFDNVKKWL